MENISLMNENQTLKYLIENNSSIARFGDGEFALMVGKNIHFQKYNAELSKKLNNILSQGSTTKCLIGVPTTYKYSYYDVNTLRYWKKIKNKKLISNANAKINIDSFYGSSFITRIESFRFDFDKAEYLNMICKLFDNSKNIFVVNEKVRDLIKVELLDHRLNICNYIIIPCANAYESYDEIKTKMLEYGNTYKYCICAGPTATVLSHELSQCDYTIYDLGHFFQLLNDV